jgi:hypothetical protein
VRNDQMQPIEEIREKVTTVLACPRRLNFEPPCRLNFEPGAEADF